MCSPIIDEEAKLATEDNPTATNQTIICHQNRAFSEGVPIFAGFTIVGVQPSLVGSAAVKNRRTSSTEAPTGALCLL